MQNGILFIALSLGISLISMPIMILICKKANLYDYQDERKIHKGNIPRLGGIGIFIAIIFTSFLYILLTDQIFFKNYLPILLASSIIFIFGIIDDVFNLRAIVKLLVQLIASSIVVYNGFRFNQIFNWVLPLPLSYILTLFWIIGIINAYNLIDGLDGLCGSLSFLSILTFGILYAICGNNEGVFCFIVTAGILGFLFFNFPPAKIFMGDGGSQFLGFLIAVIPLFTSSYSFEFNKFLIVLVIVSIPLLDTIAAIWRRLRDHRPIMSPDRAHLHHKLMNLGYSGKQILLIIILMQLVLCGTIVSSVFVGSLKGTAILLEAFTFMTIFFCTIHYANRKVLQKIKELTEDNKNQSKSENPQVPEQTEE